VVNQNGSQQVQIDPSQALIPQATRIQKLMEALFRYDGCARQTPQVGYGCGALRQFAASQFPQNERMEEQKLILHQSLQPGIRVAKMANPDGGIHEDHFRRRGALRLRGGSSSPGMVPPRAIKRRPASLAITLRSASLISALFSRIPVYSYASRISSSSRFSVVRMHINTDV